MSTAQCPFSFFNPMFACLTPMYTPRSRWDGRCILSKFQIVACHGVLYYSRDFPGRSSKKIAFEGRVHCVGWKTPHVVQIIFINIWKASLEPLLSISIKMCNYPGNIYLWLGTIGWGPPGTNWHDCPSASFCHHTVPRVQYSQLKDLWIFFLLSWEEPKT